MRRSSLERAVRAGGIAGRGARGLLVLLMGCCFGSEALVARVTSDTAELDRLIEEALSEVPIERSAEAIRFLLDAHLGTASVHAVSPGSFWDHDAAQQEQYFNAIAEGYFPGDGSSVFGGCRYIPLHLRGDATITGLVLLFVDETNGGDFVIEIRRKQTATNADAEILASAVSSGDAPGHRIATDFTIANGTIDNGSFAYFLWACTPYHLNEVELHGIYVSYTY